MMKARKVYTCYELSEGEFSVEAKVSRNHITLINRNRNYKHTFEFNQSKPSTLHKFSAAMRLAADLSEVFEEGES